LEYEDCKLQSFKEQKYSAQYKEAKILQAKSIARPQGAAAAQPDLN